MKTTKGRIALTVLPQTWLGEVPRHECADEVRPCPRIDCRYHLWTEITTVERSQPGRYGSKARISVDDLRDRPSCAIDVADDGPKSLAEVAAILGVSRVAVTLTEKRAKRKMERNRAELYEHGLPSPRSRY
jgi:hypothetical protein